MSRIGLRTLISIITKRDASILIGKRYNEEKHAVWTKHDQIYVCCYKGDSSLTITTGYYRYWHNNIDIMLIRDLLRADIIVAKKEYKYTYTDYGHAARVSKPISA